MKYKPSEKQISWGITAFITVALCVLFTYVVYHARLFMNAILSMADSLAPVIYGIIIAFILNPILNFLEEKWLAPHYMKKGINVYDPKNRKTKKRMRIVSTGISILLFIAVLVTMIVIVGPQLVMSIQTIASNINAYIQNVYDFFENLAGDDAELQGQVSDTISDITSTLMGFYENTIEPNMSSIIETITSAVVSVGKFIWNFIIGIIVSIYVLYSKDTFRGQAKKLAYSLFKERTANEVIGAFRYFDHTFIGFLTGKLLDSLIIGIICFIATSIIGTPFNVLMSVIVAITNIVPFFGPFIGAIIGGIIVFMISPIDCLWFVILCLALQTFDGYILGPKILGDSTGLSTFWVIFAIMFFGGIWGFIGWIVGVPLLSCFYEFASRLVNHWLKKKNLKLNSEHLQDVAYYENEREYDLGSPGATKYYANMEHGNRWAKALGIDVKKKNTSKEAKEGEHEKKDTE